MEDRYPPADVEILEWDLGGVMENVGGTTTVTPGLNNGPVWESQPLNSTLYIAGVPRLHVDVTTATLGGQLYALLEDCNPDDNCIHIGHAIMDLRYHEGGNQEQTWLPIFDTINAKMEFFAMDVQIEAGHTIRLSLASTGEDYLPASTSSIVEVSEGSSSNLLIDIINPEDKLLFNPPSCMHQACLDWLNQTA